MEIEDCESLEGRGFVVDNIQGQEVKIHMDVLRQKNDVFFDQKQMFLDKDVIIRKNILKKMFLSLVYVASYFVICC